MPYLVERLLEVHEDVVEVLLVLEVLLAQYLQVKDLLCCAAPWAQFHGAYFRRRSGRQPMESLKRRKATLVAFHESAL